MKEITLVQLKDILSKADIYGLISEGAPEDEYDSEAEMLYEALKNGEISNDSQFINKTEEIFKKMFWDDIVIEEDKKNLLLNIMINL